MLATSLRRARGFTLIELMVTVAIVGILAAVAIPAYQAYLVKGNRAAAQVHLMNWAAAQSQYLADARSYATLAQLVALEPVPSAVSAKYTLEVTVQEGPPRYTMIARPIPAGSQAADGVLEIDSSGRKLPAGKW